MISDNMKPAKPKNTSGKNVSLTNNYGTGIKNPVGRIVRDYFNDGYSDKKIGKPPKSLA